jgi:hypothetical protein
MNHVYTTLPELDDDPDITLEEMLALFSFNDPDAIEMYAEIDGVPLQELETYRVFSEEAFDVWLPEDNVWDLVTEHFGLGRIIGEGTHSPNATDGFWLMVNPLSKGAHVISFNGSVDGVVDSNVEYTIKVK